MFFSAFKVEEGHCASLESFGKARRDSNGKLILWDAGLHSKKPWEKVHALSLMEKTIDLQSSDQHFHTMTQDGTVLTLSVKVRVKAKRERAEAILYQMNDPMDQVQSFLTSSLRNEIANFGEGLDPGDSFIQLRNQQTTFLKSFQNVVSEELEEKFGITLLGLDLIDITPPHELATALNSVQTAQAEGESLIARAHAMREKRLFSAKKKLEIAKFEAEASEKEMNTIGTNLFELKNKKTLQDYVNRREDEVNKQSKLSIIKKEEL
jgi:regulator of protease activity HflC (stomatin/prohibitin superfamily)